MASLNTITRMLGRVTLRPCSASLGRALTRPALQPATVVSGSAQPGAQSTAASLRCLYSNTGNQWAYGVTRGFATKTGGGLVPDRFKNMDDSLVDEDLAAALAAPSKQPSDRAALAKSVPRLRVTSRKANEVLRTIRKLSVTEARRRLKFNAKKVAKPILRVMDSAVYNAVNNFGMDESRLYVHIADVQHKGIKKQFWPRAKGMVNFRKIRFSQFRIILKEWPYVEGERRIGVAGWTLATEAKQRRLMEEYDERQAALEAEDEPQAAIGSNLPRNSQSPDHDNA